MIDFKVLDTSRSHMDDNLSQLCFKKSLNYIEIHRGLISYNVKLNILCEELSKKLIIELSTNT